MSLSRSHPPDDVNPSVSSADTPDDGDRFPVVGIGASAGGLEAFTQFLSHLPIDTGMAFVLVQHLDPSQKSLLSEILARTTQMPVHEVQEGIVVEPNQIYVIPSNTVMTILQGVLHLTPREKASKISKTIDTFFYSLAEERSNKAIGVVLSGGDGDGSLGLEAIKAAGGITFAQSEDSAQVPSMPNNAVATGQVDFILPPEQIATELANISHHPYVTTSTPNIIRDESSNYRDALSTIFTLLQTTFKIDFTNYKHTTLQRRIFRRMALHRLEHLVDYVRYLQATPAELQALYQEILIHVTSFFRDPLAFETLRREVFPVLLRDSQKPALDGEHLADLSIRVWVAGCSTGEEAYSIAICLLEFLAYQSRQPQIQIFATDISELAIEKARLGIYLPNQVADLSADRLQRFFVPVEGGYQINKTVRERCVFARQNLIGDPPFSRMDLISCRNVLIYFGTSLQKKVLPMFHYGLKPTGFLMLGSSETVGEFANLFHLVDRKYKIYAKQSVSFLLPMELEKVSHPIESPPLVNAARSSQVSLSEVADQIVLNQYAPVGVVVNAQLDIIQFRGQTGAYLEPSPGQASLNVLSMIREELRLDLRTAIHQAKQDGKAVRKEGIQLKVNPRKQVRLDVVSVRLDPANNDYFLILFSESVPTDAEQEASPTSRPTSARKKKSQEQAEIIRLEQELEATKAYLRSIIEEQQATNQDLMAANEEILSSNEELQSTNEELQTAKEEIQATNEELSTINDELYRRNAETIQVSNDFQNLLSSINIPILMLEGDLRIRRFTPTAAALFNLIPTDIGRPLSDIKHNLTITDLEAQILEVINTLHLKTQEVQDQAGYWYDLRIRPYRTLDNRIDGAVVILVEIDTLKRSTEQLREIQSYAEAIAQTVHESLIVLDTNLHVVMANQRFYDTFQISPSDSAQCQIADLGNLQASLNKSQKCQIFDLGNGEWNIPQLRSLLEDLLTHNTQIENFQLTHIFEHLGQKQMRLNACRLSLNNGVQLILLAIKDESDRSHSPERVL
jgi:two-component system, chemotaxis family, CheB/CheR fusion protein